MGLPEEKAELRAQMRAVRTAITDKARKEAEDDIAERLYGLPAVRNAKVVAVYQAYGGEASVNDLVRALRLLDPAPVVAYPAVVGEGNMVFFRVDAGENPVFLQAPAKPAPSEQLQVDRSINLKDIDIMLVPGVAFSEDCRRLGQGGGFYDRVFPHLKGDCLTVGIAFDEQICPQIPCGVHDKRVDYVVTPSRLIRR